MTNMQEHAQRQRRIGPIARNGRGAMAMAVLDAELTTSAVARLASLRAEINAIAAEIDGAAA
jgi:hypothetical protein